MTDFELTAFMVVAIVIFICLSLWGTNGGGPDKHA